MIVFNSISLVHLSGAKSGRGHLRLSECDWSVPSRDAIQRSDLPGTTKCFMLFLNECLQNILIFQFSMKIQSLIKVNIYTYIISGNVTDWDLLSMYVDSPLVGRGKGAEPGWCGGPSHNAPVGHEAGDRWGGLLRWRAAVRERALPVTHHQQQGPRSNIVRHL